MTSEEASTQSKLRPKKIRGSAIVRHLVKYYSKDSESLAPTQSTAEPDPSIELPNETDFTLLRHDPTLTAFAQLAAFRLDVPRAIISLIDHEYQFVLAEATRTVSLQDSKKTDPGDELVVGTVRLPAPWGLCPGTMDTFDCEDGSLNQSTDNITANRRCYVINDLAAAERFKERSYVTGPPFIRFYAEVPLKIDGYVIGGLCVIDDKPRAGLDIEAIDRLVEVATAIIEHFELVMMQDRLHRFQEMIQALGQFADGKQVRDWWKDAFNSGLHDLDSRKGAQATAGTVGVAHTITTESVRPKPDLDVSDISDDTTVSHHDMASAGTDIDSLAVSIQESLETLTNLAISRQHTDSSYRVREPRRSNPNYASESRSTISLPNSPLALSPNEDINREALKLLFSRASHLIKQSGELDGIIFIDASLQDLAIDSSNDPQSITRHTSLLRNLTDATTPKGLGHLQDDNTTIGGVSTLPDIREPSLKGNSRVEGQGGQSPICDLLGYAIQSGSVGSGAAPLPQHSALSQTTLRNLLQHYPQGEIFHFNKAGSLLNLNDYQEIRARAKTNDPTRVDFEMEKEQLRAYQLLEICPGARAIVFFPLWDPQKDQWFAGSIAWTNDPARLLQKEDVTVLAAFGSCIMAEKSKMDALTADRAQTDFISSVSHELRSPLHGVLATTELLIDTKTDEEQAEMIRTIAACGDILLDTLDHILDYAKFNSKQYNRRLRKVNDTPRALHMIGRVTTFDLADLVETAVEGIFAGHNHRHRQLSGKSSKKDRIFEREDFTGSTPPNMNPNVMIIVEIQKQPSWVLESQIGAWKRILTNLFGNALKYTESGFVRLSLRSFLNVDGAPSSEVARAVLTIEDSGIGMSQDFLKHRLYAPFSQADPHSTGTGLGLSIVRQLVTDLQGSIEVNSELDYGTGVKVSIPMNLSSPQQSEKLPAGREAVIRDIAVWCKDLTLCLVGFDFLPELDEPPTGILTPHARRMLALRASISNLATEWFGLQTNSASSIIAATGDILIGMQSQIELSQMASNSLPLIVFEDFYSGIRGVNEGGIFHLSQPVGPQKLAKVLGLCLSYKHLVSDSIPEDDAVNKRLGILAGGISDRLSQQDARARDLVRTPSQKPRLAQGHSIRTLSPSPSHHFIPDDKPRTVVLLVEDNTVNMKILINHMKRAKEDHVSAYNGLEAVQAYQAAPLSIKIIFMDIAMPVKDGIEATQEIRQFEAENSLPRVRIVAVTCFSSNEYQKNAFAAGIDMFLVKPVPMKTLKPVLEMDPNIVIPP